jgi:membrane protein YdbS with pleckstrin-like domain
MNERDAESDEESGTAPRTSPDPPGERSSAVRDGDERVGGGASPGNGDSDPDTTSGTTTDGGDAADGDDGGVDAPRERVRGAGSSAADSPGAGTAVAPDHARGIAPREGPGVTPGEVDVEELIGPVRKLDPRVRYVWVLGSVMGSLVLGGIAGVVGFVAVDRPLLGVAVFLFLLGLGAVLAVLRYRSWSYEVREDSLYLERGVITRTRTVVPYVRIQHVDASRGPVERALGLATAVVYTAGSRGADVSIPGLTTDRADDLQERLKRLAIAAEGEDAV